MTREEAIKMLRGMKAENLNLANLYTKDKYNALDMAIKALETVEEFEKAQIITGGRLNGRTYAYKCGLEDGKRKALEKQKPILDKIRAEIEQIEINGYIRDVECFIAGINTALNVINKYKAESEVEE